jgi:hypothetical protein
VEVIRVAEAPEDAGYLRFVDIESPYSADTPEGIIKNIRYARACVFDCLSKNEIPYASHLFFTQPGILDDNSPTERMRGIIAGKAVIKKLEAVTVVYTDQGISRGMQIGIEMAEKEGRKVEYRSLGKNWEEEFAIRENGHSHIGIWLRESKSSEPADKSEEIMTIYIAGPYTPQGDLHDAARIAHHNVENAIRAGIEVMKRGHIPYIPHLTHFIHLQMRDDEALPKEAWYKFDENWESKCNALLYLGRSQGADAELARAKEHGFRIFYSVDEIPDLTKRTAKQKSVS